MAAPKQANSTKVYVTEYTDLNGVDFSSGAENTYRKHSPTAVNMISDAGGNPMKRRGWERIITGSDEVLEMWSFKFYEEEHLLCHIKRGTSYYISRYSNGAYSNLIECSENIIGFFTSSDLDSVFNVISDGVLYEYVYSKGNFFFTENKAYVPTITIGGNMTSGGGTAYESINILSNEVVEKFLGSTAYTTPSNSTKSERIYTKENRIKLTGENIIDKSKPVTVTFDYLGCVVTTSGGQNIYNWGTHVNGGKRYSFKYEWVPASKTWRYTKTTYTNTNGTVTSSASSGTLPESNTECYFVDGSTIGVASNTYHPLVLGEDNVSVRYTRLSSTNDNARTALMSCTQAILYENRVWLTGASGDNNNKVWYSSSLLDHNAYYPDTNYIIVGSNDTSAKGLVSLGEYLGVVKEPSSTETTVYLVYSTSYDENTVYACKSYVSGVGAVSSKTFSNVEGECLFLSKDGIYGITPTAVKNRSYYVNKRLCEEENLESAVSVSYNGYYILCVNSRCYVMDTRQKTSWRTEFTNYLYECYYLENIPAIAFAVYENNLWFAHKDGSLCRFRLRDSDYCYRDDVDTPIFAEWSTPLDNDGATQLYKTLQKKGTVATLRPYPHTSADLYINVDDVKEIHVGKRYCDVLDFQDIWFSWNGDISRFTFVSNDAPIDCFFKKKVKKYKRLQFIVRNNELDEPFMVESIFKTYTVKGYSKKKSGDGVYIKEE